MGLSTSPKGAFLSERTIGERTGKVPQLVINGRVGKWYCPPEGERSEEPRSGCLDLRLSAGKL